MKKKPLEVLLWSIALPGFGQFLNQKYFKGFILIVLEFIVNIGARLNLAIIYSFQGNPEAAIQVTDFQWLLFYPCLYMFGMWDGYKDAGGGTSAYATLPFVLSAFLGTVGVIFSPVFQVDGVRIGPVWLPMIFSLFGILVGLGLQAVLGKKREEL